MWKLDLLSFLLKFLCSPLIKQKILAPYQDGSALHDLLLGSLASSRCSLPNFLPQTSHYCHNPKLLL